MKDYELDLNSCTVASCFLAGEHNNEPISYEEAKGNSKWGAAAMREAIKALQKNETWNLMPKPKSVTCKWVYQLKKRADGTVDMWKARLVARGFSLNYGLDYEETFSPVKKW